jgi:hypothetical protein
LESHPRAHCGASSANFIGRMILLRVAAAASSVAQHWLFGYGSLLCRHSRALTAPETAHRPVTPVAVQHMERIWAKRSDRAGMTAVGVRLIAPPPPSTTATASSSSVGVDPSGVAGKQQQQQDSHSCCWGVLIPLEHEGELGTFDRREYGYDRVMLQPANLGPVPFFDYENNSNQVDYSSSDTNNNNDVLERLLFAKQQQDYSTGTDDNNVRVWVYVPQRFRPATGAYPIAQSYVDTILRGCLDLDPTATMAQHFLTHTRGWDPNREFAAATSSSLRRSLVDKEEDTIVADGPVLGQQQQQHGTSHWIDDRLDPKYMRGDPRYSKQHGPMLDGLLRTHCPESFRFRQPLHPPPKQ